MTTSQPFSQAPEPRIIKGVNRIGLLTLTQKEVGRFLSVYTQTIIAPVITTLLFYAVFALAFGDVRPDIAGVGYLQFLAPGLIMMTMAQNAFANTSSSVMISKVQGNIVDVLMTPVSAGELFCGYIAGGVLRGLAVGVAAGLTVSFFAGFQVHSLFYIMGFAVLGSLLLSILGLIGGLWAEKFEHIAAVTNFLVMPLTFLSGTFYSIDSLPPLWQQLAQFNPFFHMIDGFRYGFIGAGDSGPVVGIFVLLAVNILLGWLCLRMLKTGYKIKS